MNPNRKVCVHACGFNVHGKKWKPLVMGMDGKLGRATAALSLAMKRGAYRLSFGTGASTCDDGRGEAEYTRDCLLQRAEQAADPQLGLYAGVRDLLRNARIDSQTKNTKEEVYAVVLECAEKGYDEVVIVSDRAHFTLVALFVAQILQEDEAKDESELGDLLISVSPAQTSFADPREIITITPPANPEDPRHQLPEELGVHHVLGGLFPLFRNGADPRVLEAVMRDLQASISRHSK